MIVILFVILLYLLIPSGRDTAFAIIRKCGTGEIIGKLNFDVNGFNSVRIHGKISKLTPGKHGFHLHNSGDTAAGCKSLKGHYNPGGSLHGSHQGDFKNIVANRFGNAKVDLVRNLDLEDVVGRSIVIHEDDDDYKTMESSGERFAYGIIVI